MAIRSATFLEREKGGWRSNEEKKEGEIRMGFLKEGDKKKKEEKKESQDYERLC